MKKILAVIRASTEVQETESQKIELLDFLKGKGYEQDEVEIIEEAGASARSLNKKYLEMIERIKHILSTTEINAVGLWNLDRLGRVDTVLIEMKNWFIEHHIQVYVKDPSITLLKPDFTVDNGAEIAWGVFATLVKQQTDDMFNKMKRGKDRNRRNGIWNGGDKEVVLLGYMVDENRHYVINIDEAAVIRTVFEEYSTGNYSLVRLANELKERGLKIRGRGITCRNIHRMLTQEAYKGDESNYGHLTYPPIVTPEIWDACEQIRHNFRSKTSINNCKNPYSHYAIKIVKCASCGSNFTYNQSRTGGVYNCYRWKYRRTYLKDEQKCDNNLTITADILHTILWDLASERHTEWMIKASTETEKDIENKIQVIRQKMNESENRLSGIKVRMDRLNQLYLDDTDFDTVAYNKQKRKIEGDKVMILDDIERYKKELEDLQFQKENINNNDLEKQFNIALDVMNEESDKARYEIIHKWCRSAVVTDGTSFREKWRYLTVEMTDGATHKYAFTLFAKNYFIKVFKYNKSLDYWYLYTVPTDRYRDDKNYLKYYKEAMEIKRQDVVNMKKLKGEEMVDLTDEMVKKMLENS